MECLSYCLAERINLATLEPLLRNTAHFQLNKHWRVLEVIERDTNKIYYIFANGTVVTWNVKRFEIRDFFTQILPACIAPLKKPLTDEFSYRLSNRTNLLPHPYFNVDCLLLEENTSELKLSLSYGFSQSIKLKYYEARLEGLIEKYLPLTQQLSQQTYLKLSRRQIRQIIGDILIVKGELNLTGNFLYQPKFFWQHPSLEVYFSMVERYLDLPVRNQSLNQQLNTLNEIFIMCNSYLESKRSHTLEIIIIILIGLEIVFSTLNLHF